MIAKERNYGPEHILSQDIPDKDKALLIADLIVEARDSKYGNSPASFKRFKKACAKIGLSEDAIKILLYRFDYADSTGTPYERFLPAK